MPVIAFDAVHEGCSHEEGLAADETDFRGLSARLELAVGAPVLLLHNLAVEHGLINGSQGKVVEIVFNPGHHPNHDDVVCRQPAYVLVDFPQYKGPPFFTEPERRTWVPVLPVFADHQSKDDVTRIQFPLCLAWALTPWKAQGMTLAKAVVRLGKFACSKPGVLFVALTRVRHPDTLLLEDGFPAFSDLRKQLFHPSFAAWISWEKRARVFFARTVRAHMRDPALFSEENRWTAEDAVLADALVGFWRTRRDLDTELLPAAFVEDHAAYELEDVCRVWARLQTYPHNFELAAVRGALDALASDGSLPAARSTSTSSPPARSGVTVSVTSATSA